jgi:hypothetical protein
MEFLHRCGTLCCVGASLWCVSVHADQQMIIAAAASDYQTRRLMSPTAAELASEEQGRVYIYDSLDMGQINAALDTNFERIQHMMFTRTHHPSEDGDGSFEVEDDGCD